MFKHGMAWRHRVKCIECCVWGIHLFIHLFVYFFYKPSLRVQKLTSMCLSSDLRETIRHHSKNSTPFHAPLHSMFYKMHTNA